MSIHACLKDCPVSVAAFVANGCSPDPWKSLRSPERALQMAMDMGNVFLFRDMMSEGVQRVMSGSIPAVDRALEMMSIGGRETAFARMGGRRNMMIADADFKSIIRSRSLLSPDTLKAFDNLPLLVAGMLTSSVMRDATFLPALEAFDNGIHVLIPLMVEIVLLIEGEIHPDNVAAASRLRIEEWMKVFGLVASGMRKSARSGDKAPGHAVIFVDMFVKGSRGLCRSGLLEDVMPYAQVQSAYALALSQDGGARTEDVGSAATGSAGASGSAAGGASSSS